jgi:formamidopyrimidine-DNA glycosylase
MPEMPEVETIVRKLRKGIGDAPPLPGQMIDHVSTSWPRHIVKPSISTFRRNIRSRSIRAVGRRGKFILLLLDRYTLIVHLMMSGDLRMAPGGQLPGPYDHTHFNLKSGWNLRFSDSRKFGRIMLLEDPSSFLDKLGPEPLDDSFTVGLLRSNLLSRHRMLKPLLMDQSFLAGVGNIYADEALNIAALHPRRRSDDLKDHEIESLWHGIRTALKQGIEHNGASIDWVYRGGEFQNHFRVYGRNGESCPRCGTSIERIIVGQRGTHYCPICQPESTA